MHNETCFVVLPYLAMLYLDYCRMSFAIQFLTTRLAEEHRLVRPWRIEHTLTTSGCVGNMSFSSPCVNFKAHMHLYGEVQSTTSSAFWFFSPKPSDETWWNHVDRFTFGFFKMLRPILMLDFGGLRWFTMVVRVGRLCCFGVFLCVTYHSVLSPVATRPAALTEGLHVLFWICFCRFVKHRSRICFLLCFFTWRRVASIFSSFVIKMARCLVAIPRLPASKSTQHIPSNCSLLDVKLLGVAR